MELERLKEIIVDVMDVDSDDITLESSFVEDFGCDSLDIAQIIMAIEDELDIEIVCETAEQIETVGDALEAIREYLN